MSTKRLHYIDCLRVFACFLVVAIHCNYVPSLECNKIWTQLLNVIGSPSSELFLAISGSLLLPVKNSQKEFYRRRFSKLLVPLLFWSLFGLIFYWVADKIPLADVPYHLFALPYKATIVGPFWFMYAIAGMYLIAPIISPYIKQNGERGLKFMLLLWGISLILPYFNFIFDGYYNLNGDFKSPLYMFSGYMGYMLLGYYLRKYPNRLTICRFGTVYLIFFYLITLIPIAFVGIKCPSYRELVMDNLQLLSAIQVICIFSIFQRSFTQENFLTKGAKWLTRYTFGVYLVHVFVIEMIYVCVFNGYETFHAYIEIPSVIAMSFLSTVLLVFFMSKIPGMKKLLGVTVKQ